MCNIPYLVEILSRVAEMDVCGPGDRRQVYFFITGGYLSLDSGRCSWRDVIPRPPSDRGGTFPTANTPDPLRSLML